ncbi:hypothetical protein P2O55_21325 [Escherichia coli]
MNYAGHEKLRADVAEVANTMCDLRAIAACPAGGDTGRTLNHERKQHAERTDLSSRP